MCVVRTAGHSGTERCAILPENQPHTAVLLTVYIWNQSGQCKGTLLGLMYPSLVEAMQHGCLDICNVTFRSASGVHY